MIADRSRFVLPHYPAGYIAVQLRERVPECCGCESTGALGRRWYNNRLSKLLPRAFLLSNTREKLSAEGRYHR